MRFPRGLTDATFLESKLKSPRGVDDFLVSVTVDRLAIDFFFLTHVSPSTHKGSCGVGNPSSLCPDVASEDIGKSASSSLPEGCSVDKTALLSPGAQDAK